MAPKRKKTTAAAKPTVVFDIDGTLCYRQDPGRFMRAVKKHLPECLTITLEEDLGGGQYFFSPHVEVLIRYLLDQGCQIAFFSLGMECRNTKLIEEFLSHERVLGKTRYDQLKQQGHFDVFSRHHAHLFPIENFKCLQRRYPQKSINDISS